MGLAVVAAYVAARRPARTVAKVPIVAALSGRPVEPKRVHRSAVPGVVLLVRVLRVARVTPRTATTPSPHVPLLIGGLVALVSGVVLLAPFFLSMAARVGRHAPIATRSRPARPRARSRPVGTRLAAISISVLIAVIIVVAAAARYGNVLDYTGPNLAVEPGCRLRRPGAWLLGCDAQCSPLPHDPEPRRPPALSSNYVEAPAVRSVALLLRGRPLLKTVWPPGRWKAGARGNASDISGALSEVPGGPSPRCARLLTVR